MGFSVAKNEDHWLRNGTVLAVIGAVLTTTVFVPGFWSWVGRVLWFTWRLLVSTVSVPVWLIGVIGALTLTLLYLAAKRALAAVSTPAFLAYKEDVIFGIRWRWSYAGNTLDEPREFCPQCDTRLLFRNEYGMPHGLVTRNYTHQTVFFCENCNWQSQPLDGNHGEVIDRVMRQIDRRLRSGEWQRALPKKG